MALTIVATNAGAETGSPSPTISAPWTPLENDAVFVFLASPASDTSVAVPPGWAELVPGIVVDPADTSMSMLGFVHLVTQSEEQATTTSWPLTNCWGGSPRAVDWVVVVVRGGNPASIIDAAAAGFQATTGTPFVLPGLSGADLSTGSLVLSALFADAPTRTYTTPSGWSLVATAPGVYSGGAAYSRDAATVVNTDVLATDIVPDAGDEYCAITVAVALDGAAPNVAPTANAGADQTTVEPYALVTLDGSASTDPDGTIVDWSWMQVGGTPTVNLAGSGDSRTFDAPATVNGTALTFELTVTDNEGVTGSDTCTVQLLPHTWWLIDDGIAQQPIRSELIE